MFIITTTTTTTTTIVTDTIISSTIIVTVTTTIVPIIVTISFTIIIIIIIMSGFKAKKPTFIGSPRMGTWARGHTEAFAMMKQYITIKTPKYDVHTKGYNISTSTNNANNHISTIIDDNVNSALMGSSTPPLALRKMPV